MSTIFNIVSNELDANPELATNNNELVKRVQFCLGSDTDVESITRAKRKYLADKRKVNKPPPRLVFGQDLPPNVYDIYGKTT